MAGYYIPLVGTPQIGEGGGGGGSDLPAVTAADNGDVLTVVNGAWDKAAPSGGGVLVVHDANGTLDKTWQEIYDAGFSTLRTGQDQYIQLAAVIDDGDYIVSYWTFGLSNPLVYVASAPNDYPALST